MLCTKCQATVADGSKFCNQCGSTISTASKQSVTEPSARDLSLGNLPTMGTGAHAAAVSLGDRRTMSNVPGEASAGQAAGVPLAERYELLEELGRGGFAVVWRARDKKLDRIVAVKRLQADMLQGHGAAQTLERFRREARAIAVMNHRNIVAVYDCDRDADGDYIVMEYIGGGSLRDLLKAKEGRLPVQEAAHLARGIAEGLAYAHRKNLVHRDIKPANILLLPTENGEFTPKILDFGLARMGGDSDTSVSGYGLGTPYYMPPEQRRDAKNVNHTADIYALGKTLYEMVSGEIPDSVDPDKIPPPPELAQIIFKCVKAKPEERYFSADELTTALAAVTGGVPTTTVAPGASAANACAACGRANPEAARFCEGCGTGLCAPCPECGRDVQAQAKFCAECGTDRAAFMALSETLARMERFKQGQKWSRVIKEAGLLPKEVRLPGDKGRAALAAVHALQEEAVTAQAKKANLTATIAAAESAGRWKEALTALEKYAEMAPDEAEAIAVRRQSYEEKRTAALLASRTDEYPNLVAAVREALGQGQLVAAAAHLAHAKRVFDAVKMTVEGADEAATELQKLATALAAYKSERTTREAVERSIQRRRILRWALGVSLAMAVTTLATIWALKNLPFRADVKAFEKAARAGQVELAQALVPRLRSRYPPVVDWQQLQQVRTEMVAARLAASAADAAVEAKKEWDQAEQECTAAQVAVTQGQYAEAANRTASARDGYRRAPELTPLGRYRLALSKGTKALGAKDWKTAEAAFQRALSEATNSGKEAAEVGLKSANLGGLLAIAAAAKDIGDWGVVVDRANDALKLDPLCAAAKQFLLDAQPVLTVRAFAGGKEITGAIITINGAIQQMQTPAAFNLDKDETYSIGVSFAGVIDEKPYAPFQAIYGGGRYGPQELKAKLEELKIHVPAGFKAVIDTTAEPFSKTGWANQIVHENTGIELVYIAPGTFTMGSPTAEPGHERGETQHLVTLSKGFYMGKVEVTREQWEKVMDSSPSKFKDMGIYAPVEQVSWDDCQAFCAKANTGFRLPTEAEWEYACRAGTTGAYAANLDDIGWYDANSDKSPHPGGLMMTNAWGLCDMHGNVWEWCSDWYGDYPPTAVTDPTGAPRGQLHVLRGGCWGTLATSCRSASRNGREASYRSDRLGFRVAVSATGD